MNGIRVVYLDNNNDYSLCIIDCISQNGENGPVWMVNNTFGIVLQTENYVEALDYQAKLNSALTDGYVDLTDFGKFTDISRPVTKRENN